jgi:TolA-binding protein
MSDPSAVTQLDTVSSQFPNTNAAQYAQLLKGDLLYAQENYAQAADAYEPLLNAHNETLRTVATLSFAAAKQATQDYERAVKEMTNFIQKNSKSFALPQAYFTLAMSQELAGKKQEAIETYKQILADYTKTYFGAVAKERLAILTK